MVTLVELITHWQYKFDLLVILFLTSWNDKFSMGRPWHIYLAKNWQHCEMSANTAGKCHTAQPFRRHKMPGLASMFPRFSLAIITKVVCDGDVPDLLLPLLQPRGAQVRGRGWQAHLQTDSLTRLLWLVLILYSTLSGQKVLQKKECGLICLRYHN